MKVTYLLLALLSGLLIALSLPGFNLSFLAWFALVPLFFSLRRKKPGKAFLLGLISGLFTAIIILHFFPPLIVRLGKSYLLGIMTLLTLSLYFALYTGVFSLLLAIFQKRLTTRRTGATNYFSLMILLPASWVSLELLQTRLFPGLPWTFIFLGYSQWNHSTLIQIADITGIYGISFLIVLVNSALYLAIRKKWLPGPIAAAVLFLASFLYGQARIGEYDSISKEDALKVAVLQGNIEALTKWDERKGNSIAERYLELNRRAARDGPDLVVWTETAIPWPLGEGDDLVEACLAITAPSRACHLVGNPFPVAGKPSRFYNAAFFILPDGEIIDRYYKIKLLAFAEAAPAGPESTTPFKAHPASASYIAGGEQTPLSTPLGKFGLSICNENSYPDFIRTPVLQGAEYLVNMTNDAWFADKNPLTWHYMLNIFRAVENRRETVVASNVGISGFIDAAGRTKEKSDRLTAAVLVGEVHPGEELTFYTLRGDVFSYACVLLIISALISSFFLKKK